MREGACKLEMREEEACEVEMREMGHAMWRYENKRCVKLKYEKGHVKWR